MKKTISIFKIKVPLRFLILLILGIFLGIYFFLSLGVTADFAESLNPWIRLSTILFVFLYPPLRILLHNLIPNKSEEYSKEILFSGNLVEEIFGYLVGLILGVIILFIFLFLFALIFGIYSLIAFLITLTF
jgi:hypothetical protein